MTNQEAIEKFKRIKRGSIYLIHQRIEGKEVFEDYSLCDMAISALQAQDAPDTNVDTISRQAAIDAAMKEVSDKRTHDFNAGATRAANNIKALSSAQPDNQTNLCDSCDYSYPDCPSKNDDVIFGNGIGNDNICACNKYKPSAQPEKLYTKADYIMALHKEYGCSLTRAEEAHNKALEYLQDKMMMKGEKNEPIMD